MDARLPIVLLLGLALAGCVDDARAPAFTDPGFEAAIPIEEEGVHDHRDPEQHRLAHGAELLDHDDLQQYQGNPDAVVGAHAIAKHDSLIAVAVHGGEADGRDVGQQGFHIFDVSDPEDLVHLSFWDAGEPVSGDRTIAWSEDGNYVFLGFEDGHSPGIAAVDVSDPEEPTQVAFWSDPSGYGPHTVAAGSVDGVIHVFALAVGVTILEFVPDRDMLPDQCRVDRTCDEWFREVGKFATADELALADAARFLEAPSAEDPTAVNTYFQTYALRTIYAHDMNFYLDPQTDTPLLLVAYAYDGLKILDISDPSAPVQLASWLPPADTEHKHYTHSVTAERIEDGPLVVVAGSETFETENRHIASPIWILDATDVLQSNPMTVEPEHLATWRNPADAPAGALGLSVHFFRQEGGFLYLSHYHGGIWALDLREDADRQDPKAFAFIMPVPPEPTPVPEDCCIGWDLDGAPMVFDVEVVDGHAFGADLIQGLSSVRFDHPE